MNEKVEQIRLCATLPGYLFVLANLSNIGDTLSLSCPKTSVDYYTGMLRFIGLEVAKDQKEKQTQYKLYVCTNFQDADSFSIEDGSSIITILLFPKGVFPESFSQYACKILPGRTDLILVAELSQTVKRKEFCVALSRESGYFTRLKTKFLRYRLA